MAFRDLYAPFDTSQRLRPIRRFGAHFPRAPTDARDGHYLRKPEWSGRSGRCDGRSSRRYGRRCPDVNSGGSGPARGYPRTSRARMGGISSGAVDRHSGVPLRKKTPDLGSRQGVHLYLYFGLHFACDCCRLKHIDHHPRRHRCCFWVHPRNLQNLSSSCFGTCAFHEPCFFRYERPRFKNGWALMMPSLSGE